MRKKCAAATDLPSGPTAPKPTALSIEEEADVVALRRHTLLPPYDCLYALVCCLNRPAQR
jgi:hypothetical protein